MAKSKGTNGSSGQVLDLDALKGAFAAGKEIAGALKLLGLNQDTVRAVAIAVHLDSSRRQARALERLADAAESMASTLEDISGALYDSTYNEDNREESDDDEGGDDGEE